MNIDYVRNWAATAASLIAISSSGCFTDQESRLPANGDSLDTQTTSGNAPTDAPDTDPGEGSDSTVDSTGPSNNGFDDPGTESSSIDAGTAQLRVIHASVDAGPVDIYLSGDPDPIVRGLGYAETSSWLDVDADVYSIELRPAGASPDSEPVFTSDELVLDDNDRFSMIAAGSPAATEDSALRVVPVLEDWGTTLADRARIRVIHAGVDAPTLVVDGLQGNPFVLERFERSAPPGVPLDVSGGERIELLAANSSLTSFTTPPLAEGDEVLVVAAGRLDTLAREDGGFGLIAVGQDGTLGRIKQDPQLFTVHGARDAGNLENCTQGFELAASIDYGEIQSARVSPGEYSFEIFNYPSGCTGGALNLGGNASGALEAGERYMLLVTGEQTPDAGEPSIQVATFRDVFSQTAPRAANISFIHGASAEQIYVGSVVGDAIPDDNVYTAPIAWRSASVETSLEDGFYLLGVADAVGEPSPPLSPLVTFDFTASEGRRQWGIISGDPSPGADDGFIQLMLVDTAVPGWSVDLIDINL